MKQKEPPIHTWVERIDDHMLAGIASVHVVRHGTVYGLAVFVLVKGGPGPGESWGGTDFWLARSEAKKHAAARLAQVVAKDYYGRLPPVGALRDVGPDGVNLAW